MTRGRTDPVHPYVSGGAGRWLPGLVAGAGPAGWTGVDASRVTLGPVSTVKWVLWVQHTPPGLSYPFPRPRPYAQRPGGGASDFASLPAHREVLQNTCQQTLEVTRTALLFLNSSLGTERWVFRLGQLGVLRLSSLLLTPEMMYRPSLTRALMLPAPNIGTLTQSFRPYLPKCISILRLVLPITGRNPSGPCLSGI